MTTSAWLNFEKFFYYAFTVELNLIISGCKKSWSNLISIHWKDCGTPEQFSRDPENLSLWDYVPVIANSVFQKVGLLGTSYS